MTTGSLLCPSPQLEIARFDDQPLLSPPEPRLDFSLNIEDAVVLAPRLAEAIRARRNYRGRRRACAFGSYDRCAALAREGGYDELTAAVFEAAETGLPLKHIHALWVLDFFDISTEGRTESFRSAREVL